MSLRERRDIVALCQEDGAERGVLFTVVRVSGSSYRRPGARMVALADGRTAGTLSGGCLEAELLRRAAWTVRNGAVVERFSTSFDDTAEIPYGLGCGGEMEILAEPLGTPESTALLDALEATLQGEERTISTSLPEAAGTTSAMPFARVILNGNRFLYASKGLQNGSASILLTTGVEGITSDLSGTIPSNIFLEHLPPAQRLLIFGAGEDAKPLVRLGAEMGYTVLVVDSRPDRVRPERFPQAEAVLSATSACEVPVFPEDAVVLMTHSYEQDRRLLAELLPLAPRYLGLLGARHRSALLLSEAAEAADISLALAVERTHAPVGLELGGDGPQAVALAIIAELQHTLNSASRELSTRRLTLEQAKGLLAEDLPAKYMHETCAVYGGIAAT